DVPSPAFAAEQHDGDIVLRRRLALLGRPAIPRGAFRQIARYAVAGAVHDPELKLRTGMPGLGRAAKPARRRLGIPRAPAADHGIVSNNELRGDDPGLRGRPVAPN